MKYDTYAAINLDALEYNINKIKNLVAPSKLQVVLKADAYGHIAKEIFKHLIDFGIENFAVANLIEALELRKLNSKVDIMVFGRINKDNLTIALEHNITINIFSKESANDLITALKNKTQTIAKVHIKINTGFNRLGFDNKKEDIDKIIELANTERISILGIFSHLALTNEKEDKKQLEKLEEVINKLESKGINLGLKHIADSIAAIDYPWARLDMVRVGAVIYGLRTPRKSYDQLNLKGTLKMIATINQIRHIQKGEGVSYDYIYKAEKPMTIGIISAGYADGLPRSLSEKGTVYINNQQAPIIGLMCMDQCMIDITNIKKVKIGDEVTLFEIESQSPAFIGNIANIAETNKNEILTRISKRVPRIYNYKGKTHTINQLLD